MGRYIDIEPVHEEIDAIQISLESNNDEEWYRNKPYYKGLAIARQIMNEQPTADVVLREELAREIFDEIERLLDGCIDGNYNGDSMEWFDFYTLELGFKIAELKKKYMDEAN